MSGSFPKVDQKDVSFINGQKEFLDDYGCSDLRPGYSKVDYKKTPKKDLDEYLKLVVPSKWKASYSPANFKGFLAGLLSDGTVLQKVLADGLNAYAKDIGIIIDVSRIKRVLPYQKKSDPKHLFLGAIPVIINKDLGESSESWKGDSEIKKLKKFLVVYFKENKINMTANDFEIKKDHNKPKPKSGTYRYYLKFLPKNCAIS